MVFADSQSGEKGASASVIENQDECREILKKMVANCGAEINKKPISITVFGRSYFNHFYRHFRKFWIEIVAVDTKLSYQVK